MSSAIWIFALVIFLVEVEASLISVPPKTVFHHEQCLPYKINFKVTKLESLLHCKVDCFRTREGICQPCQQCGHNEVIIRKCSEYADAQCGGLSQTKEMHFSLRNIPVSSSSKKVQKYWDAAKFSMQRRRKRESIEESKNNSTIPPTAKQGNIPAESSGGVSTWVFIAIGVSVLVVAIMVFLAAMMYRRKRNGLRSKCSNSQTKTSDKIYRQGDNLELEELETLNKSGDNSERSDGTQNISIPRVRLINAANNSHAEGTPFLLRSCVSGSEEPDEFGGRSRGLFSQCGDSENKLRGGNGDYHRQYVDMNYVNNDLEPSSVERGPRELFYIRNESKRNDRHYEDRYSGEFELDRRVYGHKTVDHHVHRNQGQSDRNSSTASSESLYRDNQNRNKKINSQHSTRRYLRIPPTLPSENYIEVGLDNVSICSEMPSKMEWLTKKTDFLPKNELGNYQSSSGTQTDCGASTPRCCTVFDTPWQFGGTFTSKGGVMQAKNSEVRLHVGANSIPKGEYVAIFGAIFTDTPEIRKKFKFSAEESLISPVVEYHREPDGEFQKALCLKLPHSLTEDFDVLMVKVYTFYRNDRGKVILYPLPMKQKVNDDLEADGYWEKSQDGATIDISTKHFSGYFCTTCSNTSLPSICSMVFGSHVQINSSRREVRVTLYIWDRRLTIKDYLERIRKQESDVDRQLLTDMQIPLMDEATSDSRVVMRMEVLGDSGERSCWKHICRADGSSPLFKPLQARRLYDIVHCCRQTDPIRVEWALENVPHQVPGSIFQCCIDIMHVPRDTRDYETAMREDSDDLMRTFYVRDLKVIPNPTQAISSMTKVDLKRAISEVLDESQTEQICFQLGITEKDIGNFKRKFTSSVKLQEGLVEECLRRHGMDTFLKVLPEILTKLQLGHVLRELKSRDLFSTASEQVKTPQHSEQCLEERPTDCKYPHTDTHCKVSASRPQTQAQQMSVLQKQASDDSNDTVFHENDQQAGRNSKEMKIYSPASQPAEVRNPRFELAADVCKKGSSSGSDSVLRGGSIQSSDSTNQSTMRSLDRFSVIPQVGTLPYVYDDTKKKEIAVMGQSAQAYTDMDDRWPDSGPSGLYPRKSDTSFNSKPHKPLTKRYDRRPPLQEEEETKKKELYDIHTVV